MAEPAPRTLGMPSPPWLDLELPAAREPLTEDATADVAVVGGGIIGVTTAFLLARNGANVILIEGGRLGQGVTGRTTAKVTSLHGLTYASLRRSHGIEKARAYAEANEAGLAAIAANIEELTIECDFRRKPNFTYTESLGRVGALEDEVEAATEAGLAATLVEQTDLPFDVAAAIRLSDQAEFHPIRYLLGIASAAEAAGAAIHEGSRAMSVASGRVELESSASVSAERIVMATHLPILDRAGIFALAEPERSSAITVGLDDEPPHGMFISADSPARTLRAVPHDGRELLIVGGSSQRIGEGDPGAILAELADFAHEHFAATDVVHRWSAHDYLPVDGLPYIGRTPLGGQEVLIATGMRKWGLAMGTAAAGILADLATEADNEWAEVFDPRRLPGLRAMPSLAKHNAGAGLHFIGDRIRPARSPELAPGEGALVGSGLGKRAAYRDDDGTLHTLSARCTHLGCLVRWNAGDRTWDCPCHGSRFRATGEVLEGPATVGLAPR
jgi:glycine/D-amino acid oxidase-like deaminating enzyme/nitrite reductase/ring-hydroxylating ferredoxin subunit